MNAREAVDAARDDVNAPASSSGIWTSNPRAARAPGTSRRGFAGRSGSAQGEPRAQEAQPPLPFPRRAPPPPIGRGPRARWRDFRGTRARGGEGDYPPAPSRKLNPYRKR